jgi:hypothetical protein
LEVAFFAFLNERTRKSENIENRPAESTPITIEELVVLVLEREACIAVACITART